MKIKYTVMVEPKGMKKHDIQHYLQKILETSSVFQDRSVKVSVAQINPWTREKAPSQT